MTLAERLIAHADYLEREYPIINKEEIPLLREAAAALTGTCPEHGKLLTCSDCRHEDRCATEEARAAYLDSWGR
jgi:hypothetical protein